MDTFAAPPSRAKRTMGSCGKRQSPIYKCRILDFAYRCTVARFTPILWKVGYSASEVPSLAGQRYLGKSVGNPCRRAGFRMVDDRCKSLQGSPTCSGCDRRKLGYGSYKRGLNTKIYLVVGANGMPVRILITEGTRADCKEAVHLIEGIFADFLLTDKGYDTQVIVDYARS